MRRSSSKASLAPSRYAVDFGRCANAVRGVVTLFAASFILVACGRPATESECNEIITKTATLEYEAASKTRGPVDPAQIETIRARVKDSMLRNCVGKRITEGAMRCVRNAKSAQEIQDRCFD